MMPTVAAPEKDFDFVFENSQGIHRFALMMSKGTRYFFYFYYYFTGGTGSFC
ncbi:MAG: hypothetical protein RLZZ45_744 [Bacteroidota bacterium]|jgi:hypothetical protein